MVRISKILEGLIAQTTFDTTKRGQDHSFKDYLMLTILKSEGSLAYKMLNERLDDWQLYQLTLRIQNSIPDSSNNSMSAEIFFSNYTQELTNKFTTQGSRISTLHAMIDIISDITTASSKAFALYGITAATIDEATNEVAEAAVADDAENSSKPLFITKFGTDLTHLAHEGKIDPVIGREQEIEQVIQTLTRRKKNNPLLIGQAGVGKSAIVEGLALRIISGNAPQSIANKRLISLDISSLIAGTKYRGEFEERIQTILSELKQAKDIIVFIDEIHTIVGAGSTQGSLDTANILKPALARGEIQIIGATTFSEYRENIEHDAALERRFQKITIEPTTAEQTLTILRNIAPKYEEFHSVHYAAEAIEACVTLSMRYIPERNLPDKAIDLMDETGAKMQNKSADKSVTTITAEDIAKTVTSITGIAIELKSEDEREELSQLEQHLSQHVIGQSAAVSSVAKSIRRARVGLKDENRPIGVFIFAGPTGVGKTLLAKELSNRISGNTDSLIRLDMSEYSMKHNVSRLIGAPPGYIGYGQGGQLTEAVRRRPYSVLLFDEIEKAHPDIFNVMLQILDDGMLTDGEGRKVDFRNTIIIMTSNVGSAEITSKPTIGFCAKADSSQHSRKEYMKAMERAFTPEFLNRVDDIIFFNELSGSDIEQIASLEMKKIIRRINNLGYKITVGKEVYSHIASLGYEKRYGARALKRAFKHHIEEPIANLILSKEFKPCDTIVIEGSDSGITLKIA